MRGSSTALGILVAASIGSVQAAPRQPACIEIMAFCEQAGFVRGDAKAGDRLFMDCVIPILRATPERSRASKPLAQGHSGGCSQAKLLKSNRFYSERVLF
jgi:hypothetical protein